jgi:hypothetical protein
VQLQAYFCVAKIAATIAARGGVSKTSAAQLKIRKAPGNMAKTGERIKYFVARLLM